LLLIERETRGVAISGCFKTRMSIKHNTVETGFYFYEDKREETVRGRLISKIMNQPLRRT